MSFHVLSVVIAIVNVHAHKHRVLQRAWSYVSRLTIVQLTRARKKHRIFVACDDALCNC